MKNKKSMNVKIKIDLISRCFLLNYYAVYHNNIAMFNNKKYGKSDLVPGGLINHGTGGTNAGQKSSLFNQNENNIKIPNIGNIFGNFSPMYTGDKQQNHLFPKPDIKE